MFNFNTEKSGIAAELAGLKNCGEQYTSPIQTCFHTAVMTENIIQHHFTGGKCLV